MQGGRTAGGEGTKMQGKQMLGKPGLVLIRGHEEKNARRASEDSGWGRQKMRWEKRDKDWKKTPMNRNLR